MIVYGLKDPRTGLVRYVGQTIMDPQKRLYKHLTPSALKTHTHRSYWLKNLLASGARPELVELAKCVSFDELDTVERQYIQRFGDQLTNGTVGGQKSNPGQGRSADWRKKLSEARKGWRPSEKQLEAVRESNRRRAGGPFKKRGPRKTAV